MCRQQDLAALDSSKVGSERNDLPTRPRRDLVKLSGGHLARFQLSAGDINLATIDRKTFRDHAADAYGATGHKRDLVRHTKHFGYTQTIVAVGVILAGRLGILCAYIKNMAGGKVSAVQRHKRRAKDNSSCSSQYSNNSDERGEGRECASTKSATHRSIDRQGYRYCVG